MTEFRMDMMPIDESPATISYILLCLLSASNGWSLLSFEDMEDDYIVALSEDGAEMFRLQVSPIMGVMVLSILTRMTERLNGVDPDDHEEEEVRDPWTLQT